MPTYPISQIIDGQPTFDVPIDEIWGKCERGGAVKILTPLEAITDRQRRWYKGICLPWLVKNDENGETIEWWDDEIKRQCKGLSLLKKEIYFQVDSLGQKFGIGRLTTKGVGKNNMKLFIEEILSVSIKKGWGVAAPDKDLRRNNE